MELRDLDFGLLDGDAIDHALDRAVAIDLLTIEVHRRTARTVVESRWLIERMKGHDTWERAVSLVAREVTKQRQRKERP